MAAPHKNIVYKPLDAPNPFKEGQDKAFAEILQNVIHEKKLWQKSFFINLGLFIISLFLFFHAINLQQTVPVLVNVLPSGESQYLGEVRQTGSLQVPEAAIHFQVRTFVSNIRSVSTDYQVVYNNIDDCFAMVTSNYVPIMRRMLLDNSPFELVGRIRRAVNIESVLNITDRSYQVNWTETVIDANAATRTSRFRAVVTIRLIPPTDATIRRNPLGIYIENFEMTEL
jgi:type IV secretion system protein VirB5